jgi:YesN/AraC family two-component response regulator
MNDKRIFRILIVDDNQIARKGLRVLINSFSHNWKNDIQIKVVGEAENGQEALILAQELVPNLIFMDIKMPRMDGLEATKLIKEKMQSVKVVVLSMHRNQQAAAIQSGADDFIEKGTDAQAIKHVISKFIQVNS